MSEAEEDTRILEAKQLLRSLLLPEKNGLILTALEKEYMENVGGIIPFRKCGFQTCLSFLESISDAVEVKRLSDGVNILCTAVPDRSVSHISNLVSKQKDGKCGYNRETKDILWQNQKIASRRGKMDAIRNKKQGSNASRKSSSDSPFEQTQLISKLFSKEDNFHTSTPPSNATSKFTDKLELIELIKTNKETQMSKNSPPVDLNPNPNTSTSYSDFRLFDKTPFNESQQLTNSLHSNQTIHENISPISSKFSGPPPPIKPSNMYLNNSQFNPVPFNLGVPPPFNRETKSDRGPENLQNVPKEVHIKCLELLRENPMGIYLNDFQMAFEGRNDKVPLNYTRYGYRSLEEFLSTMTMTLSLKQISNNKIVVLPSSEFCEEWASQIKAKQKAVERKRKSANQDIFENISSTQKDGDVSVMKSTFTDNDIRTREDDQVQASKPQMKLSQSIVDEEWFVKDFEVHGDHIPEQKLLEVQGVMEVMISEIITPYRFYMQLKQRQHSLASVFGDMQNFYGRGNEKLIIPPDYIMLNQICAAIFPADQKWYRGRITKITNRSVEIYFIDYGNKAPIPLDNIRLLHKRFTQLEAQAISARHYGIVPKGQAFWDQAALDKFRQLLEKCSDTGMIAIKKGSKPGSSGDIPCIILVDTTTNNLENGIQIHQEMLRLGLAEWKEGSDSGYNSIPPNRQTEGLSNTIAASNSIELDMHPLTRPVSVVAPSSNIVQSHPKTQNNNAFRKPTTSPISYTPPARTNHIPMVVNEQQQRVTSSTSGMNAIPPVGASSVSRWLETVSPNNRPSNNSTQMSISNNEQAENSPENNMLYDTLKPLIKEFELKDHTLHVFNIMRKPYLISAEVSSLFPKWKKKDHLSKMIKLKKQNIPNIEICRTASEQDHEWFFEQCLIEDVKGIEATDGDLVDNVTLYPMESVVTMLSLFGSSGGLSESDVAILSDALTIEFQSFNPNDKYWSSVA